MTKRWIISIDVPVWVAALGGSQSEWLKLISLLDETVGQEKQLLYRDEILQLVGKMPENAWVLYSRLTKLSTVGYPTDTKASYMKSSPDVIGGVVDINQQVEICCQMAYLYKRVEMLPRPIIATDRIHENEVELTKDGKNPRKVYVCGTAKGAVGMKIDGLFPKLNQDKHFIYARNLGKGRIASPFSAYDRLNEDPAKALLRKAFLHYTGEELPADTLWAKDDVHGCYVKFMHSGNNEYHGFDVTDVTKVPSDVVAIMG